MNFLFKRPYSSAKNILLFFNARRLNFVVSVAYSSLKDLRHILKDMSVTAKKGYHPRSVVFRETKRLGGGNIPVPSVVDIQIIGNGGPGNPKSLMLITDHCSYLFNCGEGTQRIATELKIKLAPVENIFITSKNWENTGGLLGMCLTLESINVPLVKIHGPPDVDKIIKMAKTFAESNVVKVEVRDTEEGQYQDHAFKIEYVHLKKSGSSKAINHEQGATLTTPENNKISTADASIIQGNSKRLMDQQELASNEEDNNESNENEPRKRQKLVSADSEVAVAYIIHPFPKPRSVDLEKCVELGIPAGPLIGELTRGNCVTLEDGKVVNPEEILFPQEKCRPIIILDCPDMDYLDSVLTSEQFQRLSPQANSAGDKDETPELIIHMSPAHVFLSPPYRQFMERFEGKTEHLILNETMPGISSAGIYRYQCFLNLLHPVIFPLLPFMNESPKIEKGSCESSVKSTITGLRYRYRHKQFLWNQCIEVDREAFVQEALNMANVNEELEKLKSIFMDDYTNKGEKYPETVFLGTGSSVPSKTRNVSGILLNISDDSSMLLDCGEGTMGQLYRFYGNKTDEMLCRVKVVFISHLHSDHHLGLFTIINSRLKAFERSGKPYTKLIVIAPIQLYRWLGFYSSYVTDILSFINMIPLQQIVPKYLETSRDQYDLVVDTLNMKSIEPVEVNHCKHAYGITLTYSSGWKIVYSGDTMPCEKLVKAGMNCDLLIHEATMADELIEEAKLKTHSTTSQALNIGHQMKAKFILLNHFSQRYAKIPMIDEQFSENVGISFDNMRVSLSELRAIPMLYPALQAIFSEHVEEMTGRVQKRQLKKKLEQEAWKELLSKNSLSKKNIQGQNNSQNKKDDAVMTRTNVCK
ncbi:hypothetical protein CHS0354_028098 [Potamilus streckersoni]|uniref:Zinc phosphodiesterase ELAC protein 2 n=1 Tax=Potamilus streckersoni TaxID=2493646 RepID=A0AAE0WCY1_9BIVA|nr:hypothetical protein CHS0354_028098 [Potamilus streckersoni]